MDVRQDRPAGSDQFADWSDDIRTGLSGRTLRETIRHESIHSALTPRGAISNGLRRFLYQDSILYRYFEEALAEAYATGGIAGELRFPLQGGYMTPGALAAEAAVATILVALLTGGMWFLFF
jgi:hypothetical protein